MKKEESLVALHEGFREKPYQDTEGVWTFGHGFTFLTEMESRLVLRMKLYNYRSELEGNLSFYRDLSPVRQAVLLDMRYNLGMTGLLKFKKTLKAIEDKDWRLAAEEMLNSHWARQVGQRADRLARMMATDHWAPEVE